MANGGKYEPKDSRNVTGTASTPDGHWTNDTGKPPRANGWQRGSALDEEEHEEETDGEETVDFVLDPALERRIEDALARRRSGSGHGGH